ncbi:MAG: DoxX family protein [Bryobacteraceae bacterium]
MKTNTVLYWITTGLIALETFVGGVMDLTRGRTAVLSGPFVSDVVAGLGYPLYVLTIIGFFKIPGAIVLLVPGLLRLKEWVYAGIAFELLGAAESQAACGHWSEAITPLVLLCFAMASWALRPPGRILGALSRER